jgi:sec-independent protein translocase protein TatB
MFDLGWSEMAVILAVALVVIGPKDLPRVAREIGRWSAKARSMAREFQRSLDDMAREAELQDIKAELEKASKTNIGQSISDMVDPQGDLKRSLKAPIIPASTPSASVSTAVPAVATPAVVTELPVPPVADAPQPVAAEASVTTDPRPAEPDLHKS